MSFLGPFLLLLGVLVVVHELGHFAMAKWFNVKVERFSVGFGPSIFRRQFGETEYVLAWLPLGGYVKMAGEDPQDEVAEHERERGFDAQSPLRRIGIALAGPAMNMLLAVAVFAGVFLTGWPTNTQIGSVVTGSVAEQAGLVPGDRVLAIDGEDIWLWGDLVEIVTANPGRSLDLTIDRDGEQRSVALTPSASPPNGPGWPIGASPASPAPVLAFADASSLGESLGLRTGDRIVSVAGVAVPDLPSAERELSGHEGAVELEVERNEAELTLTLMGEPGPWSLERLGAHGLAFEIRGVSDGMPAAVAGLETGDRVLRVNGWVPETYESFVSAIVDGQGQPIDLLVARGGERLSVSVTPKAVGEGDQAIYRIGVTPGFFLVGTEVLNRQVSNPLHALALGVSLTGEWTWRIIDGIHKLVTREVGVENLAGPIGIGKLAGDAFAREGWFDFLWLMCVISINLAILNLLPIPVLDGGHIVFALTEAVRGGPVGMRVREIAQAVGVSFVLLLMGFAFWNDIQRSWSDIISWFKDLV